MEAHHKYCTLPSNQIFFLYVTLPVKIRIIITANMSGVSASTPGAFRVMCLRENSPIGLPISSSNVALQDLATLEVPVTKHMHQRKWKENNKYSNGPLVQCLQHPHEDHIWCNETPGYLISEARVNWYLLGSGSNVGFQGLEWKAFSVANQGAMNSVPF